MRGDTLPSRGEQRARAASSWARRAAGDLYRFAFREARRALARYRLEEYDRLTIAHCAVAIAAQRWQSYDADRGTPRQWLRGIVANEVRSFRRAARKHRGAKVDDLEQLGAVADLRDERELLAGLLGQLPDCQRAVVILHKLQGATFREIAALEKTSVTRAHVRFASGMETLRAAGARFKRGEPMATAGEGRESPKASGRRRATKGTGPASGGAGAVPDEGSMR